jgi:hypothetical protein
MTHLKALFQQLIRNTIGGGGELSQFICCKGWDGINLNMSLQIFRVVNAQIVFLTVIPILLWVDINIYEGHATSIFRVNMRRLQSLPFFDPLDGSPKAPLKRCPPTRLCSIISQETTIYGLKYFKFFNVMYQTLL